LSSAFRRKNKFFPEFESNRFLTFCQAKFEKNGKKSVSPKNLDIFAIIGYNTSNEQFFIKNRHISLHLRHVKNARTVKWQMN